LRFRTKGHVLINGVSVYLVEDGSMKICSRCGAQNGDDSVFCSKCGNSMAASPVMMAQQVNYVQQPVESNPGTLWLVLNIVFTVLSCCFNIFTIIGIIFGAISVSKYNKGLYADARSNANVSKWLFIVSIILGVIGVVISLFTGLIPIIIAAVNSGDFSGFTSFN
jgi:uncharacterized membrane protein YvbJ